MLDQAEGVYLKGSLPFKWHCSPLTLLLQKYVMMNAILTENGFPTRRWAGLVWYHLLYGQKSYSLATF